MVLATTLARVRSLLRKRGWLGAVQRVAAVLYRRVVPRRVPAHPFDVEHGVATGGHLFAKTIRSGHPNDAQSTAYFGSQPSVVRAGLHRWMAELRETGQHPQDFTFLDIGCGKGRVLMLASEFPFRRALGLELSPGLALDAAENLKRWAGRPHLCSELSVVQADVLDFPLPPEPTLLYLYHPFEGELFQRWVDLLLAVLPLRAAPLYLLYVNPVFEEMLRVLPHAHLLWNGYIPFTAQEIAAHLFGGTAERVSMYRLTPRPA